MEKPDPRDPKNWLPRELFAAYVGDSSDDMLAYYDKAVAKKNPMFMSFNLLAILVLPAWLGLRSQWAMWASTPLSSAACRSSSTRSASTTPLGPSAG
jgi:hypothetical protein